jgi:hypothetical protein
LHDLIKEKRSNNRLKGGNCLGRLGSDLRLGRSPLFFTLIQQHPFSFECLDIPRHSSGVMTREARATLQKPQSVPRNRFPIFCKLCVLLWRAAVIGIVAWLLSPAPSLAWNAEGHMIVAQIAYNHLTPAVKARCDALIAVPLTYSNSQNNTFVTAACWADDYKSQLGSGTWHYIDLPFSLDGTSTNGVGPDPANVVWAINQCVSTLGSPGSSQINQATYLRYLLHFVGDIQQPLHSSTAVSVSNPSGDAGGNGFHITGTWGNLHSLWDAGGGFLTDSVSRPLTAAGQTTLSNKVTSIETDYPYLPNPGTIPDPMNWALDSFGIAKTVAYVGITANTTPSTAYLNTAQATTEQRMVLGGHYLADLLNTLLVTNAVSLSWSCSSNQFGFSWPAIPGRNYQVLYKDQLEDPAWSPLTNFVATTNSASFSESMSPTQRFYRVTQ